MLSFAGDEPQLWYLYLGGVWNSKTFNRIEERHALESKEVQFGSRMKDSD